MWQSVGPSVEVTGVRNHLLPFRNFGNFIHYTLPVSFGRYTKSRWSILYGIYVCRRVVNEVQKICLESKDGSHLTQVIWFGLVDDVVDVRHVEWRDLEDLFGFFGMMINFPTSRFCSLSLVRLSFFVFTLVLCSVVSFRVM